MKTRKLHLLRTIIILMGIATSNRAFAEDIRIVAPYVGNLKNIYANPEKNLDLQDSGLLTGIYFQWIDTERFQWNAFVYYAPDVNFSGIVGGHFIFDYYIGDDPDGKWVLGAGLESVNMNFDAGDSLTDIKDFTINTCILVPYGRIGKYLKGEIGSAKISILPWAGMQPEWVSTSTDMKIDVVPGPGISWVHITDEPKDYFFYGIAGLNLKLNLFHFIDLEGKYQGTFDRSTYLNTWSANANVFFTRQWGLSYRFKYMENTDGSNTYHYVGIACTF